MVRVVCLVVVSGLHFVPRDLRVLLFHPGVGVAQEGPAHRCSTGLSNILPFDHNVAPVNKISADELFELEEREADSQPEFE